MEPYVVNVFALPVVLLAGLVLWYRYDRRMEPTWRRRVVFAGLLSNCTNVALFVRWQLYMYGPSDSITGGLMRQQSSGIALWLTVFGLACAIAGKGIARGVLALASVMGLFIWVIPAIL